MPAFRIFSPPRPCLSLFVPSLIYFFIFCFPVCTSLCFCSYLPFLFFALCYLLLFLWFASSAFLLFACYLIVSFCFLGVLSGQVHVCARDYHFLSLFFIFLSFPWVPLCFSVSLVRFAFFAFCYQIMLLFFFFFFLRFIFFFRLLSAINSLLFASLVSALIGGVRMLVFCSCLYSTTEVFLPHQSYWSMSCDHGLHCIVS